MNETYARLRRERDDHQGKIRQLRDLIHAHEVMIRDIDRRLRSREHMGRLELREDQELSGRRW